MLKSSVREALRVIRRVHLAARELPDEPGSRSFRSRDLPPPLASALPSRCREANESCLRRNRDRSPNPSCGGTSRSNPRLLSSAQSGAVRRSCQTIARAIGLPVLRLHTRVVSRWFVIPIAASLREGIRPLRRARLHDRQRDLPNFLGIVLDPTGIRVVLAKLRISAADDPTRSIVDEDRAAGRPLVDGKHVTRPQHVPPARNPGAGAYTRPLPASASEKGLENRMTVIPQRRN